MKKVGFITIMFLLLYYPLSSQAGLDELCFTFNPSDSVREYVTIGDNSHSFQLKFGLDPRGTDTIDAVLGEFEIPPLPPTGVFDARFIGTNLSPPINIGQGLWKDIRNGNGDLIGIRYHQLKFQMGYNSNTISISWNFPRGINGKLYDLYGGVIVNDTMTGFGTKILQNPTISTLIMKIYYNQPGVGVSPVSSEIPEKFILHNNYPNPFNSSTKISFDLPKADNVCMKLFDISGKYISTFFNDYLSAGKYSIVENFDYLTSGVYFVVLQNSQYSKTNKITLIK